MGQEGKSINQKGVIRSEKQNSIEHRTMLEEMHNRALVVLNADRCDPRTFSNYNQQDVARDMTKAENARSQFVMDEAKLCSDILEAIMLNNIKSSNWLGHHATPKKTSTYDDLFNHADLIIEIDDEQSAKHLALAIDVTFGSETLNKKFDQIKGEIHADELGKIKYFESPSFKGELRQVPRVVIGVEIQTVVALAHLWMSKQDNKLKDHFVKDIILEEIERQLRTFFFYAKGNNAPNAEKSYSIALSTINEIRRSQTIVAHAENFSSIENDRVFRAIRDQLKRFEVSS